MNTILNFRSRHFKLHRLGDGVFAAIAINGGHAICNSGLIDLGGQILVFDTFLTTQAATDLRQFAIEKYSRTPQIVINSHYHNDHIWGNQVFAAEAQIISSACTRELITTAGMEEFQWNSTNSAQRLESLRLELQNVTDEQQQMDLLLWIGEYEGIVEALPHLTVYPPNITFDRRLEVHGAKHTCELITFDAAHTDSDTVLYLPQDRIVFTGDILFNDFHPYLGDGDPKMLLQTLREIDQLDATCFVPGHGRIGTPDDLKLMIEYIEHCLETGLMLVGKGGIDEESISQLQIPDMFKHWQMTQFYRTNIKFICDRLSNKKG